MRLKKQNTTFWVAVLLSMAAAISLYATFHFIYRPVKTVIVATTVEPGEQLRAGHLKLDNVFAGNLNPKAVRSMDEAVGMYASSALYPGEQLIADRLIREPDRATGAFSYLQPSETYVAFSSDEARWPSGIREGDTITALAVGDGEARIVGQGLRVIGTDRPVPVLGQLQAMRQAVPDNASSITVAVSRDAVTQLLLARAESKAFYLLPEHPGLADEQEALAVNAESRPH